MRAVALVALSLVILTILPVRMGVDALPTPSASIPIDPGPTDARYPSLAVDGDGGLHVARSENKSAPRGIYYAGSADGIAWGASLRIDDGSANAWFPQVAVERETVPVRGRVYVAYQTGVSQAADMLFVASDDGIVWNAPRRIDNAPPNNASTAPVIAASMGRVYTSWLDARDQTVWHVYFRGSLDGGLTWGPEVQVSTQGSSNLQARIDAKGDTVVIAWRQDSANGPAIAVARSEDAGGTWLQSYVAVAPYSMANLYSPDVFLDDLLVAHVAWAQSDPETHVRYAWSADGASWPTPVRVDDVVAPVTIRAVSLSGVAGTRWVAWDDNRNGDADTFASWSVDGLTWGDGLVNGNDLRMDDTDRNANPGDDATIQERPIVRTGGFGVFALWDDTRGGTYDTYVTTVQVSPLVITEIQDTPPSEARVEIYNFGRTPFDFAGATLYAGASAVDLTPLGSWPARSHAVVGASGDLTVPLDLGTEGSAVRIERGLDVLATAGSGTHGIAPDPLVWESTARFAGTLDYVSAWTRSVVSTFGVRNAVPPPNLAPPVVLNEVLFNGAVPTDVFAEMFARSLADLTGYRLVGDAAYTFSGGTIGGADPYGFLFESAAPAWWADVDATGDNLYLYDAGGRLLDMFGWSSPHAQGRSATRVTNGVGATMAYDDVSALANGWAFDSVPTLALVGLRQDMSVLTDIGTTLQFVLTATNFQSVSEVINIERLSGLPNWSVTFAWPDGTPLSDSPADPDAIPDLGVLGPSGRAAFRVEVRIPIEPPLGDGETVVVSASAATKPVASASVTLAIGLRPHFDILRTVSPSVVYLEGSGAPYNEVAEIEVVLEGAGIPVEVQIPQDVVFQIDVSGSMNFNDPSNLRVAAVNSYIDGMRVDDRGSVIGFTDAAWVVSGRPLTYTTVSGKIALKSDANTTACSPGCIGGTNIDAALQLGNNWLMTYSNRTRTRVEILLTDGQCSPPCLNTNSIVDEAVAEGIVVYTIGLGSGADRTYLESIANRTGGRFYQASSPQDLLQIYAEIGTRINRTAGVDPDTTDASPMIEDAIAPYLNTIPGSFHDPVTGAPRPPDFMLRLADRTILQWNVSSVEINETWAVTYSVRSTRIGVQDVALHPDARVAYLRWDNSVVYQPIPQAILEVLGPPTPPSITATSPAHGEIDVALDEPIQVVFSEDMNAPTVTWALAPVVATTPVWADARTLRLTHNDFAECTQQTVHVTSGEDLQSEFLVAGPVPNPWSFTTVCPPYVLYSITRYPELGNVTVDGANYTVPATFRWLVGDMHRIATIDLDPVGGSRFAYLGWDDGGAIDHTLTVGTVDTTIVADYALQHPATLTLVGLRPAWPASVGFTLFSTAAQATRHDTFTSWVDDASTLEVNPLVTGIEGERFITGDTTTWVVLAPLAATIRYEHQFTATVRVEGLDGLSVSLDFSAFAAAILANVSDAWTAWVDAGSIVRVDDVIFSGARERYRTLNARQWQVDAPLDVTVPYLHQFRPRVFLSGTDADHTVGASWRVDRQAGGTNGLAHGMFEWADAGTTLSFDNETTGFPRRQAHDPTTFVVSGPFDATIRYWATTPPRPEPEANWKPILALVYAIGLVAAGVAAGSRALDRYVPEPRNGDREKRRAQFAGLTLDQKLDLLTLAEIEEKVTHDRRFTRILMGVPFAVGEAAIGVVSLATGVFRIPDQGTWLPLGFWANTAVLAVGLVVDLAIRRKGYRLSEADLLALAEAREREVRPLGGPDERT
jgi:hypothetical protein